MPVFVTWRVLAVRPLWLSESVGYPLLDAERLARTLGRGIIMVKICGWSRLGSLCRDTKHEAAARQDGNS